MAEYSIRQFRPADVDDLFDLFATVFGDPDRGREWFAWKYRANPSVDHVPILVAESDDNLVGARPFFAMWMTVGGHHCLALQPCDTMVHPDHRREGLFTRMTERAIERYERGEPAFFFNFPNDQSGPGYRKLGWQPTGTLARCYRFQNLAPVLPSAGSSSRQLAGSVTTPLVTGYNKLRDLTAPSPPADEVRREEGVPAATLAAIASRTRHERIHAVRDEQFYDWRFDNPNVEYTTYLAEDRSDPVGLIAGRPADESGPGPTATRIVDVVPLDSHERPEQLASLLDRVLTDHADSDLVIAPAAVFPSKVLRHRGFQSEEELPLSYVRDGRQQVVRELDGWELNGFDIRDEENWTATFAEMDTY